MTVSDLARIRPFYTDVLQFAAVSETRDAAGTTATMRLGEETLLLVDPKADGFPVPPEMPSNDRLFQHLAIVVSDMDAAHRRLVEHGVALVSAGPQTLPRWNYDAAGIRALYFRDPDGHFLELIQFPTNKGEPKWQRRDGRIFLGIDHTAIVVRDMKASRHFYRDVLGLTVVGESLNYGGEQERLSGVPGARVKITGLRGARGPGIELLHYEQPGTVDTFASEPAENDLVRWQINLQGAAISESPTHQPLRSSHTNGQAAGVPPAPAEDFGASRAGGSAIRKSPLLDPDGHALHFTAGAPNHAAFIRDLWHRHWPRYLMEGAQLGIFMIVALALTIALEHPQSPIRRKLHSELLRRFLVGLGIGVTVIALIYCQWGRQSGAHFNPAVTLAFLSLGKIEPWDAAFYIAAQFLGGWLLLLIGGWPVRRAAAHEKVKWVATEPKEHGAPAAFAAEFAISFLIFFSLLQTVHHPALEPWIGVIAGLHLCAFITFEAPFSGMSLNPARSVASALPARSWKAMWVYFTAPPLAMLLAARLCRWWIDS